MTGRIGEGLEILLQLPIRFASGWLAVDVVVDTGYDSELTIPEELASGLPRERTAEIELADGTERELDVVIIEIEWLEKIISVSALVTGNMPLIGVRLLANCRLTADFVTGGPVAIVPLDASQ